MQGDGPLVHHALVGKVKSLPQKYPRRHRKGDVMLDYFDDVDSVNFHERQRAGAAAHDGDQRQRQRHARPADGEVDQKRYRYPRGDENELSESERPHDLGLHLNELRNGEIHNKRSKPKIQ